MKKLITVIFFLLIACTAINAQDSDTQDSDAQTRDVYVKILNKKGRPVRNVILQSGNASRTGRTDRQGLYLFKDMTDNDTISMILPNFGLTHIPIENLDSIVVILRSASLYSYIDNDGQDINVQQDKIEPSDILDVEQLLKIRTYNSLAELLQGRVAGLNIKSDGMGNNVSTTIRGQNSILSSSEPLVVIDGIPQGTLDQANYIINVHDIKTIEVLKSASEWGVRGANGVILIVTKTE